MNNRTKTSMIGIFIYNQKKLLILSLLIFFVATGCRFYFKTTKDQFNTSKSPISFDRGKNLTFLICSGCHYDKATNKFIGKRINELPKIGGQLYSANLTHSATNGTMPHYTDAEFFYLLKTGIARNGRFMPYMMIPTMADDDINDILVYLRSDDTAVAAADTTVGKTHINLIGRTGIRYIEKPQPYNKGVQRPDENNEVAYGHYLVGIIGCYHCHSAGVKNLDYAEPEKTKGYMAGGMKFKNPQGKKIYGPNLTPDEETGTGRMTKDNFRNALREGMMPGYKLSPPMPQYPELTNKQSDAIYAYLRSLSPKHHTIKRN